MLFRDFDLVAEDALAFVPAGFAGAFVVVAATAAAESVDAFSAVPARCESAFGLSADGAS
jgi:hypothetical protein